MLENSEYIRALADAIRNHYPREKRPIDFDPRKVRVEGSGKARSVRWAGENHEITGRVTVSDTFAYTADIAIVNMTAGTHSPHTFKGQL